MFNFLALLISEILVAYITIVASDWPCTYFTPKVFLFSISLLFVRKYYEEVAGEVAKLAFLLQHDSTQLRFILILLLLLLLAN